MMCAEGRNSVSVKGLSAGQSYHQSVQRSSKDATNVWTRGLRYETEEGEDVPESANYIIFFGIPKRGVFVPLLVHSV